MCLSTQLIFHPDQRNILIDDEAQIHWSIFCSILPSLVNKTPKYLNSFTWGLHQTLVTWALKSPSRKRESPDSMSSDLPGHYTETQEGRVIWTAVWCNISPTISSWSGLIFQLFSPAIEITFHVFRARLCHHAGLASDPPSLAAHLTSYLNLMVLLADGGLTHQELVSCLALKLSPAKLQDHQTLTSKFLSRSAIGSYSSFPSPGEFSWCMCCLCIMAFVSLLVSPLQWDLFAMGGPSRSWCPIESATLGLSMADSYCLDQKHGTIGWCTALKWICVNW